MRSVLDWCARAPLLGVFLGGSAYSSARRVERPGLIFARGVFSEVGGVTPFPGGLMHEPPHVLIRGPF